MNINNSSVVKSRFSSLDTSAAITSCKNALLSARLQNIYDTDSLLILKFNNPNAKDGGGGGGGEEENQPNQVPISNKLSLLIEAGTRIHTTTWQRNDKNTSPSNFNIKLRKHLKGKRLCAMTQLGHFDRRIDLTFGQEDFANHLIIEFFAQGNIILTDHEYKILSVMRVVVLEGSAPIAVGQVYETGKSLSPTDDNLSATPMDQETLENALKKAIAASASEEITEAELPALTAPVVEGGDLTGEVKDIVPGKKGKKGPSHPPPVAAKKKSKKKALNLRNILKSSFSIRYGPSLVDHAIALSSFSNDYTEIEALLQNPEGLKSLTEALQASEAILESMSGTEQNIPGYILATTIPKLVSKATSEIKEEQDKDDQLSTDLDLQFKEFHPFLPAYFVESETTRLLSFPSFNDAVDEFFSKVETQKFQQKGRAAEQQSLKKLESVKNNSLKQIESLQLSQARKEIMAFAIESNLDLVNSAIQTICSFVASGMDWRDLEDLVKEEQGKGNPLALAIVSLKLKVGMISLKLPDPNNAEEEESDEDDDEARPKSLSKNIVVDVDIYSTAFANARTYYGEKKKAAENSVKSIQASAKVIENAEKKILQTMQKSESIVPSIIKYRPPYWFEKFLWFISSENYLIVGGIDSVQSEQLVTKYMKEGDFYVNADMDGSTVVIVKPLDSAEEVSGRDIPHMSLSQAGAMSICQSKAWENKITTSAYWVRFGETTKTSFAGDDLPAGVFNIKKDAKKNYLPPIQLVYGVGLMFMCSKESAVKHFAERRPWISRAEGGSEESSIRASVRSLEEDIEENALTRGQEEVEQTEDEDQEVEEGEQEDDLKEGEYYNMKGNVAAEEPLSEEIVVDDVEDVGKGQAELEGNDQAGEEREEEDETEYMIPDFKKSVKVADNSSILESKSLAKKAPLTRGQKSKQKKIQAKYADQDEDERELALEMLGSAKGPQPKGKKAKAEAEKQLKQAERAALEKEKWEARQKSNAEKNAGAGGKSSSVEKSKAVKSIGSVSGDSSFDVPRVNLNMLTGQPIGEDELHACIPVLAPWSVLQKYKYKLKLVPGGLKRGKASKSVQSLFINMARKKKALQELEFINQVSDADWIKSMMSKVKIIGDTPKGK